MQQYHVQRGTAAAAALAGATGLRGLISNCTGCAIVEQRYVLPGVELATPNPAPGISTPRHAVFIFSTVAPDQYAIIAVPGMRNDILMTIGPGAGVAINPNHPAVAALVGELTNGSWLNRFGHAITALEAAYLQVRDAVFVPDWLF